MKKQLPFIGSRELVSFPKNGASDVPAKVDTGADFSSIWASDIQEQDGELSFVLFGPGSRFYTGERITTKKYSLTYVRNSFGHGEERYKVELVTRIQSKKIRVEFRLADRSTNRYPILIGKKTLQGRFIVDVTRDGVHSASEPLKVLVMNSQQSSTMREFFDGISKNNSEVDCHFATYDDVSFEILGGAISCSVLSHKTRLSDYDLIYFKTYFKKSEIAAAVTEVAGAQGIDFIDQEVAQYHALTKLTQYVKLARFGVGVPDSIAMSAPLLKGRYNEIKKKIGIPFVMKDVASEKGESNYVVRSIEDFKQIRKQAEAEGALYVCQRFVENDGDYRVIVLNKTVEMVIHRVASGSTHLTNTSKGGQAKKISPEKFDAEPTSIATRAAVIMSRQVAGVDLVFDKVRKKWLVFEVNNSPQIAHGSYLKEKQEMMSKFLQDYARK
jgi:glutathione synthase/RimK-type ligase-like ATP-grasp enzyme